MIEYLIGNKEWIFSGIGVTILSWFIFRNSNKTKMTQKSGNHSTSIQVGGDLSVSIKDEKCGNK